MKVCGILFFAAAIAVMAAEPPLKVSLLEKDILCVQASRVPENFPEQIQSAAATNKFSGLILDLRSADGTGDIAAGKINSGKSSPFIVLVNAQTRGGAAGLAARLQTEGRAILIGGANPSASLKPDITVNVRAEDETDYLANPFAVTASHKAAFASLNSDVLPFIDHTSEAELVRRRVKDGEDTAPNAPRNDPAQPVIRDPALARAVDLVKALAVLNKSRG